MSKIGLSLPGAPISDRLFNWQFTVNAAFAGGSMTAAVLNLVVVVAYSLARGLFLRERASAWRDANHA